MTANVSTYRAKSAARGAGLQATVEEVIGVGQKVFAKDLVQVSLLVAAGEVVLEGHPVGPEGAEATLPFDEVHVALDRVGHGEAGFGFAQLTGSKNLDHGVWRRGRRGGLSGKGNEDSSLPGLQLDGLGPRRGDHLVEHLDWLPAATAVFVPFEVVRTLGVMLVRAIDQDMIPNNFSIAFDDRCEAPLALVFDLLDDVDAVGVLSVSSHVGLSFGGARIGVQSVTDSIKFTRERCG